MGLQHQAIGRVQAQAQVIHQLAQAQHLSMQALCGGRREGAHPVLQGFDFGPQGGQRGAQFMGHIAQPALARGFDGVQLPVHVIEGLHQPGQLVMPLGRQQGRWLALGDGGGWMDPGNRAADQLLERIARHTADNAGRSSLLR